LRLILLSLLAAALPAWASDAPEHVLPMWMQGGHPAVAVSLDGRAEPLRFVVDSAAGATLVDARVVRRYGLDDAQAAVSQAQGASANAARLQRMRSTAWQLGSWQLNASGMQVDLSSLAKDDDPAIDGLIGNDLTGRWDTRWDFGREQLALWTPGRLNLEGPGCQPNALPGRSAGLHQFGFIMLTLGTPGVEAVAVVDTGAACKGHRRPGWRCAGHLAVHPARHERRRLAAPFDGGPDQRTAGVQGDRPGGTTGADPRCRCDARRPGGHRCGGGADLPAPARLTSGP
jgi:Aspartyl protease